MKSTPVQKNLQLAENFALMEELSDEASSQVSGGILMGGRRYDDPHRRRQIIGGGLGDHPSTARY